MSKYINSNDFSQRPINFIKFKVERFLIKGPFYQLLFIAIMIALISFICGAILIWIEPVEGGLPESSWWAFLRMSDPGYLGDDNGTYKRVLATILTIIGYVLFMGSLVAIMTQWLYKTMRELEAGFTAITAKGHISILGYTNRTPILVDEILSSKGRLKRFLDRKKLGVPQIVILNQEVSYELTNDLSSHLDSNAKLKKVIFRTGNPMQIDDLGRVNVENSSVVVIPSSVYQEGGFDYSDTRAIKSLLSIKNRAEKNSSKLPLVVVELLDDKKREVAELAYGENLRVVSSRIFISRLIAQNIHHSGLSLVFSELLSNDYGNEVYIKRIDSFAGKNWGEIRQSFNDAIPIGIIDVEEVNTCHLNPEDSLVFNTGDLIIFIARSFESIIEIKPPLLEKALKKNQILKPKASVEAKNILILGWSKKVSSLAHELLTHNQTDTKIDVMSIVPIAERIESLKKTIDSESLINVTNIEGDYSLSKDLKSLGLQKYDNIIFLANDWIGTSIDADARSILGYLLLSNSPELNQETSILIELADPENEGLFSRKNGEVIISPYVISNLLANVALRPNLNIVFDELFQAKGHDIIFVKPSLLNLSKSVSFEEISKIAHGFGMIALGIIKNDNSEVLLNPKASDTYQNIENYKIVVLH